MGTTIIQALDCCLELANINRVIMKKLYYIMIIMATLIPVLANGQIDEEIREFANNELNSTQDTLLVYYDNGRLMLVNCLYEDNFERVVEIKDFLEELSKDSVFTPFSYHEEFAIFLLTKQWDSLNMHILNIRHYYENFKPVKYPGVFMINVLSDKIRSEADNLVPAIVHSGLDPEAVEVLMIVMNYMHGEPDSDAWRERRKAFVENNPSSSYKPFLERFFPGGDLPYVSMGFTVGGGATLLTGGLKRNYFGDATFNIDLNIDIHDFYGSFGFRLGSLKLKEPFEINEPFEFSFEEGYNFELGMIAGKFGYNFIRNRNIHLAPYAYLSCAMLSSQLFNNDAEGEEFYDMKAFSFGPGIHTEIKLYEFEYVALYGNNSNPMDNVITLQINTGYNYNLGFCRPEVKGNLIYFDIGLTYRMGTL